MKRAKEKTRIQRGCGLDDTKNDQGSEDKFPRTHREAPPTHQVHSEMDLNDFIVFNFYTCTIVIFIFYLLG